MSTWKPPADAKPVESSEWKPPADAVVVQNSESPSPGKPQAPPASQGGAGAPSTTAVTPQEPLLPPSVTGIRREEPTIPLMPGQRPIIELTTGQPAVQQAPTQGRQIRPFKGVDEAGDRAPSMLKKAEPEGPAPAAQSPQPLTDREQESLLREANFFSTDFTPFGRKRLKEIQDKLKFDQELKREPWKHDPNNPDYEKYHSSEAKYDVFYGSLTKEQLAKKQAGAEESLKILQAKADKVKEDVQVADFLNEELLRLATEGKENTPEYAERVSQYNETAQRVQLMMPAVQDLASSYEVELSNLMRRDAELKQGQGTWGGAIWNSVVDGMVGMDRALFGSLLPDIFAEVEWSDEKAKMWGSKDNYKRRLKEAMSGQIEQAYGAAKSSGTTEEYMEKLNKDHPILAPGILGLSASIPAMATPAMSGIFLQVADGIEQEMEDEKFDDVGEWEKKGIAYLSGAIGMTLERIGFKNLASNSPFIKSVLAGTIQKLPQNASAGTIQRILDAETMSAARNFTVRVVGGAVSEAETGALQTAADLTVKMLYNEAKDKGLFDTPKTMGDFVSQVSLGAVHEAIGGKLMATPMALSAAMGHKGFVKSVEDSQFGFLEKMLKDPNFKTSWEADMAEKVKQGKVAQGEVDKAKDDWEVAQRVAEQIPDNLPVDKRREAFDILLEKEGLKSRDKILAASKLREIDEKLAALAGIPADDKAPAPKKEEAAQPAAETAVAEEPVAQAESVVAEAVATEPADSPVRLEATPPAIDLDPEAEVTVDEVEDGDPDAILGSMKSISPEQFKAEMESVGKSLKGKIGTQLTMLSEQEFMDRAMEAGADAQESVSQGFFLGRDNAIYINESKLRSGLAAHEGMHAVIFNALLSGSPNGRSIISSSAKQALDSSPEAKKALLKFLDNYGGAKTKADGSVDVDATVADPELAEEVMSEFVAALYNGSIKLDNAMRQFIRDLYNRVMAALGVSTKVEFKEDGDFIAAAKQIASAMKAGRKIDAGADGGKLPAVEGGAREAESDEVVKPKFSEKVPAAQGDFKKGKIKDLLDKKDWVIMTAENPNAEKMSDAQNASRMKSLMADLDAIGAKYTPVDGKYGNEEKSLAITGVTEKQAIELGKKYGQESVLTNKGLVYQDGSYSPATGITELNQKPDDFYSVVNGQVFQVDIDFDQRIEAPKFSVGERRLKDKVEQTSGDVKFFQSGGDYFFSTADGFFKGIPEAGGKRISRQDYDNALSKERIKQLERGEVVRDMGNRSDSVVASDSDKPARSWMDKMVASDNAVMMKSTETASIQTLQEVAKEFGLSVDPNKAIKPALMSAVRREINRRKVSSEASKPKFSKRTDPKKDLVPPYMKKDLTDDGKGNYLFFHYGPKSLSGGVINPRYFGKGANRGRGDSRNTPISNYYTKAEHSESSVRGDKQYVVAVPKGKVYPLTTDPLGLYDAAEKAFRKDFGKSVEFSAPRQADYIGPLASKAGFDMMVAGWSVYPLRAESTKALKPDSDLTKKYSEGGDKGDKPRFSKSSDQAFNGSETPKTPIGDTKTVTVDGKERTVFNSNGKPIHPTVEGVRNFWRWFGESKVVDAEGRPLVVYHGTDIGRDSYKPGTFFTPDAKYASGFAAIRANERNMGVGGEVVPAYLRITNPLNLEYFNERMGASGGIQGFKLDSDLIRDRWKMQAIQLEMKDQAIADEFFKDMDKMDGVIGRDAGTNAPSMMIMDPTQIKSATGNYGTFDPSDPDIRKSMPGSDISKLAASMISAGHNTLAKAKAFLESRGRADLYDQVAKEYARIAKEAAAKKEAKTPPPPKQEPPKEEKPEPAKGKRATAQRQLEDFPELKQFLTDGVLDYDKITLATTFDQAKALVEALGVDDAATRVVETTDKLPYAVSNMMGRIIAQEYLDTKQYDKLDNFERRWLAQVTDMAQGLAAMQTLYGETYTAEVLMFKARKLIREEQRRRAENSPGYKKVKKGLQQANKETVEQVIRNRKVADTTTKAATPKPDTSAGKKESESYGSRNKVVTKSKYDQAWKELRSQMPSGIPPQLVTIAAYHIEAGSRSFAAVAEKVVRKGGKKLLPYLKGAYKQAAKDLGVEASTDVEIDEYIAKTNTDKAVAKLKAAIASGNQKQADEAIASLQEVAKEYGLWGQYKELAAERLQRISEQNILRSMEGRPAVEEFVLGLVRNITAQIKAKAAEAQGPKNEPKRRSDIEIIGDAYKNFERYKEVWAETQNQFKAKLRAAEARLAKAEKDGNKDAADKARADIAREQDKLAVLDAYYGDLLPTPFSEEGLGRAVKEGMKQLDQKIDNIIRQHYTVYESAKRTLTEKLVQDAGLSEPEASELAKAVQEEFDKLATERKRALIEQYTRRKFGEKPKRNANQKALEDELILLSNTGAFSDSDFLSKYGEMMGWPSFNAETAAEIKRLADRVQTAPKGRPRFEAVEDLLAYQANLAGVSKMDLVQAVWYANMLSGYETQEVNFLANATQVMIEAGVAIAQKPALQNTKGVLRALAYGMRRGWLESGATLRTGYSPIRGKVEVPAPLERYEFKSLLKPYNLLKYVGRVMKAADVLFFETAKELRAYQWAAAKSKNSDPSISERRRYQELMNQTDEAVQAAQEQAEQEYRADLQRIRDEGLTGKKKDDAYKKALRDRARRVFELIENKRDADILTESARFAARVTYNYKPEGTLGAAANSINQFLRARPGFRYVVPFVNIIANVANESMNFYPPTAWARVARGGSIMGGAEANKNLTEDQIAQIKRDAVTKAIIGTSLMVAAFIASGDDEDDEPLIEITSNGFGNWRDNETLQKSGWRPYSFKIRGTDTWVSYQYTPLILVFGLVGHYRDATKYRKEKIDDEFYTKTSIALGRNMQTFLDQTFLTSVNELLSTAIDTKSADRALEDAARTVGRMAKTLVQPNLYTQIARSVQDAFEIPNKDVRGDIMGELMKDIPVLRDRSFDRINALGEPVVPDGGILRRFFSGVDDDPVWSLFKEKGYALNAPSPKAVTVPDRQTGEPVPASEEQVQEFYKLRGSFIRKYVETNRERLEKLDRDDFAKKMREVVSKASRMAKRKIGFGEAEEE